MPYENMKPASLANLNRGWVRPQGWEAARHAGENRIIAAIAAALQLEAEFSDDDRLRWQLGKVSDFEITPEVRAAIVEDKARQVWEVMRGQIVKKLAEGEKVSINGFATFARKLPDDTWPAKGGRGWADDEYLPLEAGDTIIGEAREARIDASGYQGGALAASYDGVEYPNEAALQAVYQPGQKYLFVNLFGVGAARVIVTGTGTDNVVREYVAQEINIGLVATVAGEWRQTAGGGQNFRAVITPTAGQMADVNQIRGVIDWSDEASIARAPYFSVAEWPLIRGRWLDKVGPYALAREAFGVISPDAVLSAFPRYERIVRGAGGSVWEVSDIPRATLRAAWAGMEAALQASGRWPGYLARTRPSVTAKFRREFVEKVRAA